MSTVVRILSGRHPQASFANVLAVAEALGMTVRFEATADVGEIRERQAWKKANYLIGMLQGTSGLEGQALDEETLREMERRTVHELLTGSARRLWGE